MELPKNTCNSAFAPILLLLLLLLPSLNSAQLQPHHSYYHHHHHPRSQLYYEAPRLRRYEYAPSSYITGYPLATAASAPALAGHYQQQPPNFQLINYRPSYQPLALEYQQQQPPLPVPAPVLPSIYPQPSVQYQQRSIAPHMELAKYRYEGNYLPIQRVVGPVPPLQQQQQQQQQQLRRVEEPLQQLYNVPPALFTSDVLHVIPPRIARLQEQHQQPQQQQPQTERPRRNAQVDLQADAETAETRSQQREATADRSQQKEATASSSQQKEAPKIKETKYFHDIFMRFDGPHSRSHGHVLKQPKAEERRFEMQRGTNRYKGEVIWTDRQGSHGEHRWDMAQGKL